MYIYIYMYKRALCRGYEGDVGDIYSGKEGGNYYVASHLGSTCKSSHLQVSSYLVIGKNCFTFGPWRFYRAECPEFRSGYIVYQDRPCTLNWGYMVPNSVYLSPNRG